MANRVSAPNLFASLSPPWLLSSLDQNSGFFQTAFNDSSLGYLNGIPIDTGSANLYTIALPFGTPSSYQDGMAVVWIPANGNSGASTLTVSPLGSASILTPAGNALLGGEISQNVPVMCVYKSAAPTGFRIVGPCPAKKFLSSSSSVSLECAGCTSAAVDVQFTVSGLTITFNHVGSGVPLSAAIINSSGGSGVYSVQITDPTGTNYSGVTAVTAGGIGSPVSIQTGVGTITLANNQARILTGITTSGSVRFT